MHRHWKYAFTATFLCLFAGCSTDQDPPERAEREDSPPAEVQSSGEENMSNLEKATFGGGCFWCTEAVFLELEGVHSVVSGYSGGHTENPTYEQICTGLTGHAEVIQVEFDPEAISYKDLLEVFWKTHDPTTLNRQGPDRGTQYRSVVFYHNEAQQELAAKYKKRLNDEKVFRDPVVTEISPLEKFYPAEDYHQNYYAGHQDQPYCRQLIGPKLEKFRKAFADKLK